MQKITLPKWATLSSITGGRLIHIGNGEFIAADAHMPKIIETCKPNGANDVLPETISSVEAPAFMVDYELGVIMVEEAEQPVEQ